MGEGPDRGMRATFSNPCDGFHQAFRLTHMAHLSSLQHSRARTLRRNETPAEIRLWEELRGRRLNGYKFVRQQPIGPNIADFACREAKLIVEVDGATHGSESETHHDLRRTQFLNEQGWKVFRVQNNDVFNQRNAVCDGISLALLEIA